jgi:hypothetical protein
MHPPKGKEDQDNWVFEEVNEETGQEGEAADPSFEPLSSSAEPLNWGSDLNDGKVCVCPSSLPCLVHNLTESHQLLKRQRCMVGTSEGTLRLTSEGGLGNAGGDVKMLHSKACCQNKLEANSQDHHSSCLLNTVVL